MKTGIANFEFRILPTHGGQLTAFLGAIAVCLDQQRPGAFWDAKDEYFQMAASGQYNENSGRVLADKLGLDYNQALTCARTDQQIQTDYNLAVRLGVGSTPAVLYRSNGGEPQYIQYNGQTLKGVIVPFEILSWFVASNPQ